MCGPADHAARMDPAASPHAGPMDGKPMNATMAPPLRQVVRAARLGGALVADLLIPRRCGVCGAFGSFLCGPCVDALPRIEGSLPVPARGAAGGDVLTSLGAACRFEGGARRLVHRLKYERLSALAGPMGQVMAPGLDGLIPPPDRIVPVPLHVRRRRDRGFNQAALLARSLAAGRGIPVDEQILARVRATPPQVRTRGAEERVTNISGAFAARGRVDGMVLLLVDDVATTGATLRECALTLRRAGAAEVHALVFARD